MDIKKNKDKYEEHIKSKFCISEDVYINTYVETDDEDIMDIFYHNAEVLFEYTPPERRSAFYPGAKAELIVWGLLFEDKYYLKKELPSGLVDWIEDHLWDNRPERHKNIP